MPTNFNISGYEDGKHFLYVTGFYDIYQRSHLYSSRFDPVSDVGVLEISRF